MANVCSFEMRIRGSRENCLKLLDSEIHCYELYVTDKFGTEEDSIIYAQGECRWSVTGSMVNTDDDNTLQAKSAQFGVELEVIGYDISEPEWIEHYHYKNGECLRKYNLPPCIIEWNFDEMDFSEEDKAKYEFIPGPGVYELKRECAEPFEWDEEEERMIVEYIIKAEDLEG